MYKALFILFLNFLINATILGQFYSTGQAPFSVKWQVINTDQFQIIYPDGFYNKANKVANLLTYYYHRISYDFPIKPKKISLLLNNQSVLSNGYVAWAPRRMEWITTPPQESYPQDWLEQLTIHEFRHVVQMTNLEQGLTRILKLAFGEAATGAVAAYLPFWLLEGDAVMFETIFSESGRGRQPQFDMELRTIEKERSKRFTYDQSYLGSYKYFIPDYYKYGYQMVTFGNLKYASKIWNSSLAFVGKHPYLGAPFNIGLRKAAGKSKEKRILKPLIHLIYYGIIT
jgi:hypothetical protein